MEPFELLLPLALILCLSKLLGLGSHKIGMPAVIGMLVAGILIGLLKYIPWEPLQNALFSDYVLNALSIMSKIGVVLIMFSAGLGTDLKDLKQAGVASVVITTMGVVCPMLLGFLASWLFFPAESMLQHLFYGAILTATSVSVTVAVLKEMGKLNTKVGTSIVAAAVIDDVIGAGKATIHVYTSDQNIITQVIVSIADESHADAISDFIQSIKGDPNCSYGVLCFATNVFIGDPSSSLPTSNSPIAQSSWLLSTLLVMIHTTNAFEQN